MPIFSLFWIIVTGAFAEDSPVVNTAAGAVRGFISSSRSGRQYLAFRGVPFARPPLGSLRFRPPEEPLPWTGVKNATDHGPWCIQYNMFRLHPEVIGSEDCLYLSVFTHNTKGRAPVMVHIHGGGFIAGDKSETSPKYLMDEDVVVVGINYRLGIIGFLSFEDEEQPGNQGMKDQVMALRWVKKNIASFGGNPDRVTLVGESAGSASVMHHVISPLSKGLFHRAIAESGTSYNTWTLLPPGLAKTRVKKLASLVSCPLNNTKEAVVCFQGKDAKELVAHMEDFREWQIDPLMLLFQPVLEAPGPGAFLSGPVKAWKHNPVPLLIGTTSGDGLLRTNYFHWFNMDFRWYNDNFDKIAPLSMQYVASASNPESVTRKIRQFYFDDKEITVADWVNITNAYTDSWFAAGIFEAANKHPGDVYFYYFDYVGEYTHIQKNITFAGAGHSEELHYIWCKEFSSHLKGDDLELSKKMVKIWADFANQGKGVAPDIGSEWKRWNSNIHNYLHISKTGLRQEIGLNEDRQRFWSSLNYKDKYNIII